MKLSDAEQIKQIERIRKIPKVPYHIFRSGIYKGSTLDAIYRKDLPYLIEFYYSSRSVSPKVKYFLEEAVLKGRQ